MRKHYFPCSEKEDTPYLKLNLLEKKAAKYCCRNGKIYIYKLSWPEKSYKTPQDFIVLRGFFLTNQMTQTQKCVTPVFKNVGAGTAIALA